MAEDMAKPRLGRGLAALIGEVGDEMPAVDRGRGQRRVPIEFLRAEPAQPAQGVRRERARRPRRLDPRARHDPADPRAAPAAALPDAYEIVAGERRWRAAQRAGLHEVPVVVRRRRRPRPRSNSRSSRTCSAPTSTRSRRRRAMRACSTEFEYTHEELRRDPRQEPPAPRQHARLLDLPEPWRTCDRPADHRRPCPAAARRQGPVSARQRIVDEGLTVREVEAIAQAEHAAALERDPPRRALSRRIEKDPDTRALEKAARGRARLGVAIAAQGQGRRVSGSVPDARAARRPLPPPQPGG